MVTMSKKTVLSIIELPNYSSKRALKHDSKDTSIKVVGVSLK